MCMRPNLNLHELAALLERGAPEDLENGGIETYCCIRLHKYAASDRPHTYHGG